MDISRYLTLYVSEAQEHLESLSDNLVKLEQAGSTGEVIDEAFRHAHSVKGMAASMGFELTAKLAHRMEDLLDAYRALKEKVDRASVDLLLSTTDALLGHVRASAEGKDVGDVSALMGALERKLYLLKPDTSPRPSAPPPASVAAPSAARGLGLPPRYQIKLKVAAGSATPGVRAFLAHKRLSGLGNVFDLRPPLDDLKAGRLADGNFSLELESTFHETEVRAALKTIADVELVSLKVIEPDAPPAPKTVEPEGPRVVGQEPARTVRVRTELLDQLLDGAGELLLATARVREVGKSVPEGARGVLDSEVDRLNALVKDLHAKVMKARMTPISVMTDRLPRAARDIARRRERDVELTITGAEVELDRAIVDELNDPLLHLLRNAIDHGIEPPVEREKQGKPPRGRVQVNVRREKDRVLLEVEDDGRGMDGDKLRAAAVARGLLTPEAAQGLSAREALMLACMPGVSTATDVTDISGRGVGMDAVKRAIESVGGTLEIESQKGKGTRFRLQLPLTVAVVQLLLVAVGDETFGLPVAKVSGVVEFPEAQLAHSQNASLLPFGNALLPVYSLAALLTVPGDDGVEQTRPYVVVEAESGKVALGVDRLQGQEEVVLKALSRPLDLVPGLAGVTILGNGRPIFILDVPRLLV
ncbi:MAG: chemotaxis protein CheA [Archangiaceae bacterium]|nr:chemotaxis protein CheA [Archangiaceae bacterium]